MSKKPPPNDASIPGAVAARVEREYVPIIGVHATKRMLDAAVAVMAGTSTAYMQTIRTPDGRPYMRRHFISERGSSPQVWVHQILLPDADPWCHDHPWDYRTIILRGAYDEEHHDGSQDAFAEGDALRREAETLHRLHLTEPAVTLFMASRNRRRWGFATPQGWVDGVEYQAVRA